jgi:hypothetical protein
MTNTPFNIPHGPPSRFCQPGMQRTSRTLIQSRLFATALFLLAHLLLIGPPAFSQALPAAEASPISTGFELPRVEGSLRYSVSAFESISDGYFGGSGVNYATGVNGDLAYISNSKLDPFSMVFTGGRSWATSGEPSTNFLNLALSQVVKTRNWNFVLSDSVNYLPQTPSTGLSGIPGTGDLGVPPVQVGDSFGQGVLTGFATRVSNITDLSVDRALTGKTSLDLSGSYSIIRFVQDSSNDGENSDGESGTIGLTHRYDVRNSLGGDYSYMQDSYGANQPGFVTQTASMRYMHEFSRKLSMNVMAGPQWLSSTNAAQSTSAIPAIPTSINVYGNAALNYSAQFANFSLSYSRGANSGFGVVAGAHADSVNFLASRTFARVWNCAFIATYARTTSLAQVGGNASFSSQTAVSAVQISRALVRNLSAYASYTLEDQSTPNSAAATNAFSGFFQVASFGLTYSPNLIHLGSR